MSSFSPTSDSINFDVETLRDPSCRIYTDFVAKFKKITRDLAVFHLFFAALSAIEIFLFLSLFTLLAKSSWLAISIALLLLTGFAYVVLRFYFECKKPEQLTRLRDHFLDLCKGYLPFTEGSKEFHLRTSETLFRLCHALEDLEYSYYELPESFNTLNPILRRVSSFLHWKDLFLMKQMLIFEAIDEQVKLIQVYPCDLEAHAALSDSYQTLAKLYRFPCKVEETFLNKLAKTLNLHEKFVQTAQLALEELGIIESLSTEDPWVYAQRASIYHDLERPEEEIQEYEKILLLRPQDDEVIFRLGILYFSQGKVAKGLECYEKLKEESDERSSALITLYDARFRKIASS